MQGRLVLSSAFALGLVTGCGDGPFDDPENVRVWATTASSLAIYSNANQELTFADGREAFVDPDCPVVLDDGDLLTLTGDCTDTAEMTWVGSAEIERSGDDLELRWSGFGSHGEGRDLVRRSGTFARRKVDDASYTFRTIFVAVGGMRTTYDYSGSITGDYDARTTFNGHGRVSRDGMVPPTGTIEAVTENEVWDSETCSGQPASGRTTIANDEQNAVVLYDGATDCDDQHGVHYRVDGIDQGRLTGISCSVASAGASQKSASGPLVLVLFLLSGRGLRRRRRASG